MFESDDLHMKGYYMAMIREMEICPKFGEKRSLKTKLNRKKR